MRSKWLLLVNLIIFLCLRQLRSEILNRVDEINRLPLSVVTACPQVAMEGVVIFVPPDFPEACVIHDGSSSIYTSHDSKGNHTSWKRGEKVKILGQAIPGKFAPMIEVRDVLSLGPGIIPEAKRLNRFELDSGQLNAQLVKLTGIVRHHYTEESVNIPRSVFVLDSDIGYIRVIRYHVDTDEADRLIDAEVRVEGVVISTFNENRQLVSSTVRVDTADRWRVIRPAPIDPFNLKTFPINELRRYDPAQDWRNRVKIRGCISAVLSDGRVGIQDASGAFIAHIQSKKLPVLGAVVDIVGFIKSGHYSMGLEHCLWRETDQTQLLHPEIFKQESSEAPYNSDGKLIKLRGKLLSWADDEGRHAWKLMSGKYSVIVLPPPHLGDVGKWNSAVVPGCELEVTGLCEISLKPTWFAFRESSVQSIRVFLSNKNDVIVLNRAPYRWVSWLLGVIASTGMILLFLLWQRSRKKLVEAKMQMIRQNEIWRAILAERQRLGRELHDTLIQGLTAIGVRVGGARLVAFGQKAELHEHLNHASALVSSSIHEARRAIWAMKAQVIEQYGLCGALREVSTRLLDGGSIKFTLDLPKVLPGLPVLIENSILYIAQEAITNSIKYSKANMIKLSLTIKKNDLILQIQDDGRGFDSEQKMGADHTGIDGMRSRIEECGGTLEVLSQINAGCVVKARMYIGIWLRSQ
jgi:signal transduction histidine kinase